MLVFARLAISKQIDRRWDVMQREKCLPKLLIDVKKYIVLLTQMKRRLIKQITRGALALRRRRRQKSEGPIYYWVYKFTLALICTFLLFLGQLSNSLSTSSGVLKLLFVSSVKETEIGKKQTGTTPENMMGAEKLSTPTK